MGSATVCTVELGGVGPAGGPSRAHLLEFGHGIEPPREARVALLARGKADRVHVEAEACAGGVARVLGQEQQLLIVVAEAPALAPRSVGRPV